MKKYILALSLILFAISSGKSKAITCTSEGIDENSNACDSCGENCSWSFNDGILKVSGDIQFYLDGRNTPWYQDALKEQVRSIDASQVTSFNHSSFEDLPYVTTVIMPKNITTIPSELFRGCRSLETLEIPDTVTSIGNYALSKMTALKSLIIPDCVTDISPSAFEDSTNLTAIYCTGNVDACRENVGESLADKVQAVSIKEMNGVRYAVDKNGKVIASSGQRTEKRIYTLEEANFVAGPVNRVSIKYK